MTLGVHPLSWLLSNNQLEEVCGTLTKGTFSSRLLLSNQDKGCTPSVAHSLPLPPGFCSTCQVSFWTTFRRDKIPIVMDQFNLFWITQKIKNLYFEKSRLFSAESLTGHIGVPIWITNHEKIRNFSKLRMLLIRRSCNIPLISNHNQMLTQEIQEASSRQLLVSQVSFKILQHCSMR